MSFSNRSLTSLAGGLHKGFVFHASQQREDQGIPILPTDNLCTGRLCCFLYLGVFEVNDVVTLG